MAFDRNHPVTPPASTPMSGDRLISAGSFPYYCQFASSDLVLPIIRGEMQAKDDPRWRESGFDSPEEYSTWSWRACGVACVRMVVEGFGGPRLTIREWVERGLSLNGFFSADPAFPGKPSGWVHRALAELARAEGLVSDTRAGIGPEELRDCLTAGQAVIASVTHELGEYGGLTRRTGHLVLVTGAAETAEGEIRALRLHNPSGRYAALRADAWIDTDRFAAGFSGRVISISRPPSASPV